MYFTLCFHHQGGSKKKDKAAPKRPLHEADIFADVAARIRSGKITLRTVVSREAVSREAHGYGAHSSVRDALREASLLELQSLFDSVPEEAS